MTTTGNLLAKLRLQLLEHVPDAVRVLQELAGGKDVRLAARARASLRRHGLPVPPEGPVL